MKSSGGGFSMFLLVLVALGIFAAVLWSNSASTVPISAILPTNPPPTDADVSIAQLLDRNFGSNSTPLPTIEIPAIQPTRAVLAQALDATPTAITAADASTGQNNANVANVGATPTLPPATAIVSAQSVTRSPSDWGPPPLVPPISRDPLGRDHYWFRRPVESNANTSPLLSYSYGSDGINDDWRIHHGIDIPNPIGEEVYAAASGTVLFASDGRVGSIDVFQNSSSYGNVVFIEHDFGFGGQPVYSLYAHLQAALVQEGMYVEAGDPIALVGATGYVSGPHVHFEVRIGGDRYGNTYNPLLWMVPFVGHGVIAGRVVNENGEYLEDVPVTFRSRETGQVHGSVTTYVFAETVDDVNPDPNWRENFAIGDIPVGRWDVIVDLNGQRIVRQVEVFEGTTAFVELRPSAPVQEETEESNGG